MKKISFLSFLLIFVFLFFINVNSSFAYFEYRNSDGAVTNICGFADELNCSAKLRETCGSDTKAFCVLSNYGCDYTASGIDPVCPPTQTDGGDGTYNLLAPIPGLEEAVDADGIGEYFNVIFLIAIGLSGLLAVIKIVIGGIQYMGDESIFGKTEAKSTITKAILGLIIALAAYALLNTINPELLGGGGLNIKQVTAEIEEDVTEVGPGININGSQVKISTGKAATCKSGIVDIPSSMGSGKICKDLLDKLVILKSKNSNWRITSAIRGKGSQSSCHYSGYPNSGNCADLQITNNPREGYSEQNGSTNPSWGTFCVDVAQVGGLNYLNEASKVTNCQKIQNYKTYKYTSGPHLHVNLIEDGGNQSTSNTTIQNTEASVRVTSGGGLDVAIKKHQSGYKYQLSVIGATKTYNFTIARPYVKLEEDLGLVPPTGGQNYPVKVKRQIGNASFTEILSGSLFLKP